MKAKFSEWLQGADFMLEPETIQELNDMGRLAMNAKKEFPVMRLEFCEDGKPYLYIYFQKRARINQKNSIKP